MESRPRRRDWSWGNFAALGVILRVAMVSLYLSCAGFARVGRPSAERRVDHLEPLAAVEADPPLQEEPLCIPPVGGAVDDRVAGPADLIVPIDRVPVDDVRLHVVLHGDRIPHPASICTGWAGRQRASTVSIRRLSPRSRWSCERIARRAARLSGASTIV
ncbi:MAG: hypothetical protein EB078_04820 [Proteobacteria bacterium]|nr:hypothetical protein [Pseudomonadota bacterium]